MVPYKEVPIFVTIYVVMISLHQAAADSGGISDVDASD